MLRKIIKGIIIVLSSAVLLAGCSSGNKIEAINIDKTLSGEGIKDIDIQSDITKVNLLSGSGSSIEVTVKGNVSSNIKDKISVNVEKDGTKAVVRINGPRNFKNSNFTNHECDIKIPSGINNIVMVKSDLGGTNINSIEAKEIILSTDQSNISILNSKFYKINASSNTGMVDVDKLYGDASIKTKQGSINVREFDGVKCDLSSKTGNITLSKGSGEISIDSEQGKAEVHMEEINKDINIKTSTGDINFLCDNLPTSYKLGLKSRQGNIQGSLPKINYSSKTSMELIGEQGSKGAAIIIESNQGKITFN